MWKVVWARTTGSIGPVRVARKSQPQGVVSLCGCRNMCGVIPDAFDSFLVWILRGDQVRDLELMDRIGWG